MRSSSSQRARQEISGLLLIGVLVGMLSARTVGESATIQPPADFSTIVESVHHGGCQQHLTVLQSLNEHPGPGGARAGYLLAYCLEQLGQQADAQSAYESVASRYRTLAPYAQFAAAQLAAATGNSADAANRLKALLATAPPKALTRKARLVFAEALVGADRLAEATQVLGEVQRTTSDDEALTKAWWLQGVAKEKLGDTSAARMAYTMAWWAVPDNAFAVRASDRLKALTGSVLPEPSPEARLERAKRLMASARAAEAERELTALLQQRPSKSVSAEAWYQLGLIRVSSKGGVHAFEQALRYPENAIRGLYWLGEALAASGRSTAAKAAWRRVSRESQGTIWAARALYSLALSAEAERAWGTADGILAELAARFPGWWMGGEAQWRRGWHRYQRGRYTEAEAIFLAGAQAPGSPRVAESLYWASKAREQQRRDPKPLLNQVAQRFPLTYAGQRARVRLGAPPPPRSLAPDPLLLRADQAYTVYEELAALGFDQEAADEAEQLLETSPTPGLRRFVAVHRARVGDFRASVEAAEVAIWPALYGGGKADVELWSLAYPRAYWDHVSALAKDVGVDPYLLLAVMREESRYDPRAVSPAGAIGLMQLMPYTARTLAGGVEVTPQKLMEPAVSVRYGASYLAGVLQEFGGDVTLALAAYNAGPGAARRFARMSRSDPDLFVASIPYTETRGYVRSVLETYGIYRWLYE